MKQLTPQRKHDILVHIRDRGDGKRPEQIAALHGVRVDRKTLWRWRRRWRGTPQSLERRAASGRPRALSAQQVARHVRTPILRANRAHRVVHYTKLLPQVRAATGTEVSLQTLRRYGKEEAGGHVRRGKKRTAEESEYTRTCCSRLLFLRVACAHSLAVPSFCLSGVSSEMCEQVAKMRRKLQRIGTQHILFLDETHKREGDAENYTIVLEGEAPYIETSATSSYAPRYDMIACCSGTTALPPIIYSSKERGKGVTTEMLLAYIRDLLAQAAGALDVYPLLLVVDRSPIHSTERMQQEFRDWGCQEMTEVLLMPPAAAKRLSPLDNSLFNVWRQRVLQGGPLTKTNIKQRMSDAWAAITKADIQAQYRHCGLMRHQDVYFDCPAPALHKHAR